MADDVRDVFREAELVVTSGLTLVESERALFHAVSSRVVSEADAVELKGALAAAAERWIVFDIDWPVLDRARRPFPNEPIRTLDAIHLATGLAGRSLVPNLAFLSLDRRVRASALELGFSLYPRAA